MPWMWIAAASVASSAIGAAGAQSAADTQADAARQAGQLSQAQFNQVRSDLGPYRQIGEQGLYRMADLLGLPFGPGSPVRPVEPSEDAYYSGYGESRRFDAAGLQAARQKYTSDLAAYNQQLAAYQQNRTPTNALIEDPGYQFRQQQGSQSIVQDASARGLRLSPATQKALLRFNSELASQEFGAAFSRAASLANIGQSSAVQTGTFGANNAASQGNALIGAGNAQAAGTVGAYNAIGSGVGQAVNIWSQQRALDQYLNNYGSSPMSGARANPNAYDLMANYNR